MVRKICSVLILMLLIVTMISVASPIRRDNNISLMRQCNVLNSDGEWSEQVKLMASDGDVLSFFGLGVSLDGDYAIIGAHGDDDNGAFSGAAYMFKRSGEVWVEEQKLLPSDGEGNDMFAVSVAMDGDYVIIGQPDDDSPGAAYIFKNTGSEWVEHQKLLASDGEIWDEFGTSVAMDGDYAVVGAQFDDDIGSAYIFKLDGDTWEQQAKIVSSDPELWDTFGLSVAIDGEFVVVGAFGDSDYTGAAYVFKRDGDVWTEEEKLTASDGVSGDRFGYSVSIDEDIVVVGACNHNEFRGAAYIYQRDGNTWNEEQKLSISDGEIGDSFGTAVFIDGDCMMIGAPGYSDYAGSAYVYNYDGGIWTEVQFLNASDMADFDGFGCCISIDGNSALIGKYSEDDFVGSAYIFSKPGDDLLIEINGGLGVNVVITNNGSSDVSDVSVSLVVQGGILGMINKTVTDTVDISSGESATVSTGLFFGLGSFDISIDVGDVRKEAEGVQIIILTLVR